MRDALVTPPDYLPPNGRPRLRCVALGHSMAFVGAYDKDDPKTGAYLRTGPIYQCRICLGMHFKGYDLEH